MFHNSIVFSICFIGDIMLKKIFLFLKRIIMSVLLIYCYNRFAFPLDIIIPINIITVGIVTLCGIPALLILMLFSLICI